MKDPKRLARSAGGGLRQGFDDAGSI